MVWQIVKKEVRDQLLSLRLLLTFVLILVLMAANAVMFQAEYERRLADYNQDVNSSQAALAEAAASSLFSVFSYHDQLIYRAPSPYGFVAEGHDKDLPNAFNVNAFQLSESVFTLRGNPLLWRFDSLDWAFIVSVIFSFAAIVLVYDGVNGEKERGTLRLMMSHAVPREKILLAKYISAVLVLVIPLVMGVLLDLVILSIGGAVPINAELGFRAGTGFVLSLAYISIFVLLGLFLSTRSRTPVVSLVTGLLLWVSLVIVIPATGNLVARGMYSVPMPDRVAEEAEKAAEEAYAAYNQRHPHPDSWIWSRHWSPGESLLRAFEIDQAWNRVVQSYQDRKAAQVEFGRRIASISPAALLTQALERLADSGIGRYRDFLEEARRYQLALADSLDRTYPLDKANPVDRGVLDAALKDIKLDLGSIPRFDMRFPSAAEAANHVLGVFGLLALFNLVLFALSYVSFLRYDVR